MTGSRIFGPALAAVLVETVGTAWCFLLNAASFAAVLVSLFAAAPRRAAPAAAARRAAAARCARRCAFVAPRPRSCS